MNEQPATGNLSQSALKAGMSRPTARKYLKAGQAPEERQTKHDWRTRSDPLTEIWSQAEEMLAEAPDLEAKVLFEHLRAAAPWAVQAQHLRTFQRRVKLWRLQHGADKKVFFTQDWEPGVALQLDWTHASELGVTIAGGVYEHLLCHAVLPYSNWEWATRCQSESLLSLRQGLQAGLHQLGAVPRNLRMDNSSAATHRIGTGAERGFNAEFASLCAHRILAVTAWDQGLFQASFSTVYRVLKERNLMAARGPSRAHNGHSKPPVRNNLTGPNQRWCWDISYLMTGQKGEYLFLYLLLDEWSRKVIQWRIAWHQTAEESRRLLEGGLTDQNILDLPEEHRPEIINDRGRQMKAKPIQRLCEDHDMPQLFARPRTPNDNPFIESAFSTVKRAPEYPGQFLDDAQAREYFSRYFTWYDTEHYHSGIDYVTPQQAHDGQRPSIVEQRRVKKLAQRRRRREENQKQKTGPTANNQNITMPADLVA